MDISNWYDWTNFYHSSRVSATIDEVTQRQDVFSIVRNCSNQQVYHKISNLKIVLNKKVSEYSKYGFYRLANIWRGTVFLILMFQVSLDKFPNFVEETSLLDGASYL